MKKEWIEPIMEAMVVSMGGNAPALTESTGGTLSQTTVSIYIVIKQYEKSAGTTRYGVTDCYKWNKQRPH